MIVLMGFMGAGKTTVGHLLAERLGLPFVDSDLVIEQRRGRPIREIFDAEGEPAFRAYEHEVVAELLGGTAMVLALGGGAPEHPDTRALLAQHDSVYLQVGYDEAMLRVAHDEYRPLLRRPGLEQVYQRRLEVYRSAARHVVPTDGRRPEAVCWDIIERLLQVTDAPPGVSTVLLSCTGGTYNVHIGRGILEHAAHLLPLGDPATVIVVADPADAAERERLQAALRRDGRRVIGLDAPDDEQHKTLDTVASLSERLAELTVHRGDVLIGLGGEALGNLVGFVAATYNRGMPYALVPTTLLAQADAAVGGKASVNLSRGRNLLGVVHQPLGVICDVDVARAHRGAEYQAGLAEIAKHALISGGPLLALLQAHGEALRDGDADLLVTAIRHSVAVKSAIVSRDERENGDRLFLNYGHTFAHAIEQLDGSRHGDAVALGLMAAAYLGRRLGRVGDDVVALHRRLLELLRLPTSACYPLEAMRRQWLLDKKFRDGVRFVVLNDVGRPEAGVSADREVLAAVLADLAGA